MQTTVTYTYNNATKQQNLADNILCVLTACKNM